MAMTNLLESLLRTAGNELAHHQVARFWKIPEALQKTPCDFMGFTATGRAILIEAKQVRGTSLSIGKRTNGLQPHQYLALQEANKAGALALVLWANGDECAQLSFDMVLALAEKRRSVPWKKINPKFIRPFHERIDPLSLLDVWLPTSRDSITQHG